MVAMLKRFMRYYRPYKGLFVLDMLCALFLAGADLVFPAATRRVIDVVVPAKDWSALGWMAAGLLLLFFLRAAFEFVVGYWGHVLGVNIQRDMRRDIFGHLQTLDHKFFDDTKTGQIMSRIVSDLFELAEISHHAPEDLLVATVRILGAFAVMLAIEWRLALVACAALPFMIVYALRYRTRLLDSFRKSRERQAAINERVEESISGIRVVKSFTNEGYEIDRFAEGNESFRETRVETVRRLGFFYSGLGLLGNVALVVVLAAGGAFAISGAVSLGSYVAFALFVTQFLQPISVLMRFFEMYQDGAAGFRRFLEIMDRAPQVTDAPGATPLGEVRGGIEFRNVGFRYAEGQERVLHAVDLSVPAGETVAVVGPSGAGKTTLCSLIPRFYEVEEGAVMVDGRDVRDVTLESLRRAVGVVQQDTFLFAGTVRENIAYGRQGATEEEVVEAARAAAADDFIRDLPRGYDTVVGERGVKLSGGQKQRVAIARMFLKNPPILILDEATSSLDARSEETIRASIERLSRGRTTFIIAHRLATIRHAKRIVVLTEDGIAEEGTHDELIARRGAYFDLYNAQVESLLIG
ncbi:MAG: ABC transporter ATP-binding protein [Spirochaetaceae bacterium]|nr:ABC transporter ATP-binding protein [Spirochaetaceae bacterium]